MKTRIFLLILWLMLAVTLQAQTYNQLWKRVEQMEKKDLPKSVIAEAEKIYAKAKSERNVPQMLKAYLTMMVNRGDISPDSISMDIIGLEEWASQKETEAQDKAVLYSILGEYCISDDFEKGNRYLHLSLKDSSLLVGYPAEKLVPMVETGETSRLYFDNNLYDLLARWAIRLWEENQWNLRQEDIRKSIQATYQSLLHIYKVKNMRPAWLLTALDAYPQADETQLRAWIEEYGDLDVCAEVYLRLVERMQYENEPAKRLALLREGIARYPRYNRINALKNEEKEILLPMLNFSIGYTYPGEPIMLQVSYRNLTGFAVKFYRLELSAASSLLAKISPKNVQKYGKFVRETKVSIPQTPDYRMQTMPVKVPPLETGIYYVVAKPNGYPDIVRGALMHVSALQVIHREMSDEHLEMVVLDKRSGHPEPEAQVDIFQTTNEGFVLKKNYIANTEGVVDLPKGDGYYIYYQARTKTDSAMPVTQLWIGRDDFEVSDQSQEHIRLFTDRSLYRPGQTLHFSGIAYAQKKDMTKAKEGDSYIIILQDADHQEVARQEVKTDDFGAFQGTFTLPSSGKTGVYQLRTKGGSATFRVEEYKRPTFELAFDTVKEAYQAGDSIRVTGVACSFSGMPIQGAKVSYRVTRLENRFWRMRGVQTNLVTGETITDVEGRFEVPVHFLPVSDEARPWYYTYEVSADVTNVAGETQAGILNLPLGSSSLRLFIPDWGGEALVKEQPRKLTFQVSNLMNVPVEKEVCYRVFIKGKQVLQGKVKANQTFVPEEIYSLPSGAYQLEAAVTDDSGKQIEQSVDFVLLSLADKHLPEGLDIWCYQSDEAFDADGLATVYFGCRAKDVYLFYDVTWGKGQMERQRISFSDSIMSFRFRYKEEYGDGLQCNFAYLKNGELHTRTLNIQKPKPDKALKLKWKTFRDKLRPGQQETWTLCILRSDGTPADAQLMATMYDSSLDKLAPHRWRFGLNFARRFPNEFWRQVVHRHTYWGFSFSLKSLKCNPLVYSTLDVPYFMGEEFLKPMGRPLAMKSAAFNRIESVMDFSMAEVVEEESALEDTGDVQLRTNFAETAFFYPQLRTDARGEVNIEFTLPESLTEWQFMGLAHTKEMDYGSIEAKVVASKDFMLQPNLPRFVRVGDEVSVSASLMNLSDKEVNGVVRMELFKPETEKVILNQKRPFSVKARETGKVTFSFDVTDKYEDLAIRIVADGDRFSDGEQRYLPVLSNKQKLTESVLLNVNGKGTYTFSLESLFNHHSNTISRPQMMVEFTGNPLWYAIQALKAVENPESDNALSWMAAYYANSLLAHLARVEPRIADSLKVEGVGDRISEAVLKLKDLQHADGSWSWYKGMNGSLYMTTAITQQLARLQQMTGGLKDAEVIKMYRQALVYLNKQASEEVRQMKEAEKKGLKYLQLSEWALQYLYIVALDKNLKTQADATDYLVDKLANMSLDLTIYGKALGAIILQEVGEKPLADEFLQSLMEYSVFTPGMGRYFDTLKAEYSWFSYRIPTQVAAIEAFHLMGKNASFVEELKQWLLLQKQTQTWGTSIATVNAVYALLTTGKDWLLHTGMTEIKIGKEIIRTPDDALGYVEKEVSGKVMDIKKVTVKKSTDGIGWGAVYAEFEEGVDKVSSQGNALQVNRSLYKEGRLVSEGATLQVGDKLTVRLNVIVDRDMDFVQIKDERAASMEPIDALSGYRWNGRIGYYQETKDSFTSFYLDQMRKGTYNLEYEVYLTSSGRYSQGIPVVQSVYAPEFIGHGSSSAIVISSE